jgi:hypothetical protein
MRRGNRGQVGENDEGDKGRQQRQPDGDWAEHAQLTLRRGTGKSSLGDRGLVETH